MKDILGSDVKIGDIVVLHPDVMPKMLICKVTAIQEGGLAVPTGIQGQQAIAAGNLRLIFDFAINFNPTQPVGVVKVQKTSVEISGNA